LALGVIDNINNRNSQLDQNEYISFLNLISSQAYSCFVYETLPEPMQQNFQRHQIFNVIPIYGSRPIDDPTQEQLQFLNDFCEASFAAMAEVGPEPCSQDTPAPSPVLPPSTPYPTATALECFVGFNNADEDSNNIMTREEYVTFVNSISGNAFLGYSYVDLPQVLQLNFNTLSTSTTGIDITGSKPGSQPTLDQLNFLRRVCDETNVAILEARSTPSPSGLKTSAPITLPPVQVPTLGTATPSPSSGTFTGTLNITASFLVSNNDGIDAATLGVNNVQFVNLQMAFDNVCSDVAAATPETEYQEGRLDAIFDAPCPKSDGNEPQTLCQSVFGSYVVKVANVDAEATVDELERATQLAIRSGALQTELELIDPGTPLNIEEGVEPEYPSLSPTPAPSQGKSEPTNNTAVIAGSVAGGVVGLICILVLIFCFCRDDERVGIDRKDLNTNDYPRDSFARPDAGQAATNEDFYTREYSYNSVSSNVEQEPLSPVEEHDEKLQQQEPQSLFPPMPQEESDLGDIMFQPTEEEIPFEPVFEESTAASSIGPAPVFEEDPNRSGPSPALAAVAGATAGAAVAGVVAGTAASRGRLSPAQEMDEESSSGESESSSGESGSSSGGSSSGSSSSGSESGSSYTGSSSSGSYESGGSSASGEHNTGPVVPSRRITPGIQQ
jgi:hypothetical protein